MIRDAEIARQFAAWLESYSPPRSIAGNPELTQREAQRLAAVLIKFAPADGYDGWVSQALDQLSYQMKTRAWPTVGELGAVCSNLRKNRASFNAGPVEPRDTYEIHAAKMKAGEPVPESFLYGREAVEMIARRIVDEATMTAYRSGAFFARKDAMGEASAMAWEVEAKQRHEDAKTIRKERIAA